MPTRLVSVVVDAHDPHAQSRFWSALLGWTSTGTTVEPPAADPITLTFARTDAPKTAKNRVHLDLSSADAAEQAAIVTRAESLGACHIDVGQHDVPWVVMADPEGNEFCVLEPRPDYAGIGSLAAIVVDTTDVPASAAFWSAASGWDVLRAQTTFAALRHPDRHGPHLEFLPAPPPTTKPRVHLAITPTADAPLTAEITRLHASGATTEHTGDTWAVLSDPQGTEFRIIPA